MDINVKIAQELNLNVDFICNVIELLNEGATIPFIARYRKEATGSMDEVMILRVKERFNQLVELNNRKITAGFYWGMKSEI
ncbi:MAG TPA: Tex-like N-terminal domain-containing protein, partial [Bacteroidales bacterium]|nr:Tex-like N-terminal domain-containing protein [Bacteroidales bacterium]